MKRSDIFVRDPDKLEEVFEKIRSEKVPHKFDRQFLVDLGLETNNAILYVSLFKHLGLINEENIPVTPYYQRFVESEERAQKVIANLIPSSYKDVYEAEGDAHLLDKEKTRKLFSDLFEGKSQTMVNMIADTFNELTKYANWEPSIEQNTDEDMEDNKEEKQVQEKRSTNSQDEFLTELMNELSDHKYEADESFAFKQKNGNGEHIQVMAKESTDENINGKEVLTMEEENGRTIATEEKVKANEENTSDSVASIKDSFDVKKEGIESEFLKKALVRRAELLNKLGRSEEAVKAYEDLINFANNGKCDIEEDVVYTAFYKKASLLEELDMYDEAVETYDKFIKLFS